MTKKIKSLEELISYCEDNDRVCPQPQFWNEMWEKLKEKKRIGSGWQPPLPFILAAWWEATAISKQIRFVEHLNWANNHSQLREIIDFLTSLTEEQWYHLND